MASRELRHGSTAIGKHPPATGPALPRDFLAEVEAELRRARSDMAQNTARIAALEELHALTCTLAEHLQRPPTVFDVIRTAGSDDERECRRRLVRELRS